MTRPMTTLNKHGLSRHVPAAIARRIRQECGYGCVQCGGAIFTYEHFNPPFKDAKQHDPEGMALLCGGCQDQRTRGYLPPSFVANARKNPYCKRSGFSHFQIAVSPQAATGFGVTVGGVEVIGVERIVRIDDVDILRVRAPESPGAPPRVSAQFFDREGQRVAEIVDNEWRGSVAAWDIDATGGKMVVRSRLHALDLVLRLNDPYRLTVERMHLRRGDVTVLADAGRVRVRTADASMTVPTDIPPVRRAPFFLDVEGNVIRVGTDVISELLPHDGPESFAPGSFAIQGADVAFVDPADAGIPSPPGGVPVGRFPGRKLLRVKADKGGGISIPITIPASARSRRRGAVTPKVPGRNDLCPCGSGIKYKKCHGRPA